LNRVGAYERAIGIMARGVAITSDRLSAISPLKNGR
jgi:hypothetical protein